MNRIILTGRLAKNPELRYLPKGDPVATFTLAVNRKYSKNEADFINVEFLDSKQEDSKQEDSKQEWRTVRELGEVTVNGKVGIQLQCYFGSSSYTSAEMATLIDGVISECKDMGIETATPAELARMMGEWGK